MKFIFCALSLFSSPTQAQDLCASVHQQFDNAYYNRNPYPDYFAGYCPSNVHKLTQHLQDTNIDLRRSEVLYIIRRNHENRPDTVYPQRSRNWADTGWTFHVVLNFEGTVLDLDFNTQATSIDVKNYFAQMFPITADGKNKDLLLKVIPAEEYLKNYYEKWAQYPMKLASARSDGEYPPLPISAYLLRSFSNTCN